MNSTASVSEEGSVTIPADLRRALGLNPGSEVRISISGGRLIIEPTAEPSISTLFGMLKVSPKKGIKDIDAALGRLRHQRYAQFGRRRRVRSA